MRAARLVRPLLLLRLNPTLVPETEVRDADRMAVDGQAMLR